MTALRTFLVEARLLHRLVWLWLLLVLVPLALVLRLQEPAFFRRSGVPLFWSGMTGSMLLLACFLPLLWSLGRGTGAIWLPLVTRRPTLFVIVSSLTITAYGVVCAVLTAALSFAVDSIFGYADWRPLMAVPGLALLLLAPFAALAPALHVLSLRPHVALLLWLVLLTCSAGIFGSGFPIPADRVIPAPAGNGEDSVWAGVSALLATIAGLLVSCVVVRQKMET